MRTAMRILTAIVPVFLSMLQATVQAADYTVTVNAAQAKQTTAFMQGFLHGFAVTDTLSPLVGSNLQPYFWRLGSDGWNRYPKVAPYGPLVTMVISDMYADTKSGYSNAKPWLNWSEWEQYCKDQVSISINQGKPVDYWDVWNEPDTSAMWTGTWAQLLETYQRAFAAIRSIDPNAKVVGPGTTEFAHAFDSNNTKSIADFVYELSRPPYNTRLQAISWHELGSQPSSIPGHAQTLRDFLANPTYFSPAYVAELHVNEYDQPNNSQIPGWVVGWLYYAEQANLDWFSRACWNMWEGSWPFTHVWNNCWQGLNGVFMRDMTTVQQPYYVYSAYTEINAGTRIVVTSTDGYVNGLASKDDGSTSVKAMVGIHNKSGASSVDVTFSNYPYSSTAAYVTIKKLSNNNVLDSGQNPKAQPAVPPSVVYSGNVSISGGSFTVNIASFANGEMYVVEAVPTASTPPGAATNPSPASGATNVNNDANLSWTAGSGAASHDVYFGTTNPPIFKQNQSGASYDPGTLSGNQVYYWRIDEKNSAGTTTGSVWTFATWSTAYQPGAVSTIQGSYVSGNLASCLSDDNNYYVSGGHTAPGAQFNFTIAQARADVTQIRAKVRSKDSLLLGSTRHLFLWNYDVGGFEDVGSNGVSIIESDLQIVISSNPGRFVGADKVVKVAVAAGASSNHNQSVEYVQLGINGG